MVGGGEAWLVFGNQFFQDLLYAGDVVGFDVLHKVVEFGFQYGPGYEVVVGFKDSGVCCGLGVVADKEFFVEFFAGAQACDFDFDIAVGSFVVANREA